MDSRVIGAADLSVKLRSLKTRMQMTVLKRGLREAIKPAITQARKTVPVDTGLTKKSIRSKVMDNRNKQGASAILGVMRRAYYALYFVERGTSRFPARPWLVPAFKDTRAAQEKTLVATLKAEILRIVKR